MKNLIIASLLILAASAKDIYSHAEIQINEGHVLGDELQEWLSSSKEADQEQTKKVKVIEKPGKEITTPRLVFMDADGNPKETVFVEHIPLSMVKSLFKEKEWASDEK